MSGKLHTILPAALVAAVVPALAAVPQHPRPTYREGEVLVKHRLGAQAAARQLQANLGMTTLQRLLDGRLEQVRLPAYLSVEDALRILGAEPAIERAGPNFLRFPRTAVPNDPLFGEQWGLLNTGQPNFVPGGPAGVAGADLNLVEAWDANGDGTADRTGDPGVIVAVIDDAFDTNHPDLSPNFIAGRNFVGLDNNNVNPSSSDQTHGTMVAGCVAARGNDGTGVAGVAWNVRMLPLKFDYTVADHLDALAWARTHGATIINASFGGPGFDPDEQAAIANLRNDDILYVAAAGNDDSNTDVAELNYPANLDADNIVAVAATNRQDNIASFSQYGPRTVDVAAPGLQIVTTAYNDTYSTDPGTSGTSFASPYIAGVAALIRSHVAGVNWRDIKARLIESGEAVSGANPEQRTAGGRVDADRALEMAAGPSLVIDSVTVTGGDGNGQLDPGESPTIEISVRNIWQSATGVTASLDADGSVTVDTGPVNLGSIAADGSAPASFAVTVDSPLPDHRYVVFSLTLSANGGYSTVRPFLLEIGSLTAGAVANESFLGRDVDLYDEFHAWHFDMPSLPDNQGQLVISTTSEAPGQTSPDIDLLVKHAVAPRYNITVGINPETDSGFFCTSGTTANCQDPATLLGADADGDESVTINDPAPGTYHIVIVNFAQLDDPLDYTLLASVRHPGLVAFTGASFAAGESAGTATITVQRSTLAGTSDVSGTATVSYQATAGTASAACDFTVAQGTLSWAAGESGAKTFTVPITADAFDEPDETVTLTLSNATGAGLGPASSATLTIVDDDAGGGGGDTLAFAVSAFNVFESQPTATIEVTRSCGGAGAPAASVQFATADGTATAGADYVAAGGTLDWALGETASKTFTLTLINDGNVEPNETVQVALANPAGAALGNPSALTMTIVDDDSVGGGGGGGGGRMPVAGLLLLLVLRRLCRRG